MTYLQHFLHDPLPDFALPSYDYVGHAVWIGEDKKIVAAFYKRDPLPLIDLTPDELEHFAQEMFTRYGTDSFAPEYSTRHPEFNGKHNLLIYRSRIPAFVDLPRPEPVPQP